LRIIFVSIGVVIIDQVSKLLVKGFSIPFLNLSFHGMFEGQQIPILGNFFRITYTENPGLAFGFDPGISFKFWISLFSLIASIGLIIYLYYIRNERFSLRLSIAFILGGAVGNLIDRLFYGIIYGYAPIFYGRVVDFLDFDFFNITIFGRSYDRFPIFNFADAAVTIGVLILILFYKKQTDEKTVPAKVSGIQPDPTFQADPPSDSESPNMATGQAGSTDDLSSFSEEEANLKKGINNQKDDEDNNRKEIPL
jgi:signal peptidase II